MSLIDKAESHRPNIDLSAVEAAAEEYRDLIKRKEELEEQLKVAGREVEQMAMVTLPDLLDTVGIDHIGVPAKGNQAAFDVVVRPFYKAVIAASWPEERKAEAFDALSSLNAGDLIRRTVTISIPHSLHNAADLEQRLVGMAEKIGLECVVDKTMHWNSLT